MNFLSVNLSDPESIPFNNFSDSFGTEICRSLYRAYPRNAPISSTSSPPPTRNQIRNLSTETFIVPPLLSSH